VAPTQRESIYFLGKGLCVLNDCAKKWVLRQFVLRHRVTRAQSQTFGNEGLALTTLTIMVRIKP
jgi:hypothetical protein